ncbi:3-hydroxyacyl-ACP dehydratase FabZ family protein [Thermopirellula anaerolimosa]
MRFSLIDRILELEPGRRIRAVKALSLAEEYLSDHFPKFPVLPGVLMLEALTESAAWLIRASEDFAHSIVVLREAKRIRYGQFVEPGQLLYLTAEIVSQDERITECKAEGRLEDRLAVSGKIYLERYNLAERNPDLARVDRSVVKDMRQLFDVLWPVPARNLSGSAGSVAGESEGLQNGMSSAAATTSRAEG